jgi:hypothetical protein
MRLPTLARSCSSLKNSLQVPTASLSSDLFPFDPARSEKMKAPEYPEGREVVVIPDDALSRVDPLE